MTRKNLKLSIVFESAQYGPSESLPVEVSFSRGKYRIKGVNVYKQYGDMGHYLLERFVPVDDKTI